MEGLRYRKLALIGAMEEEIEYFHGEMENSKNTVHAGILFREGTFYGKEVVVCRSGVGKVNAAVCTQVLIDRFGVDAVIFTGVAGALDPELEIGDIVISAECVQHDVDVTALGFAKGVIPYQDTSVFPANPELAELAFDIGKRLSGGRAKRGRVLSGDQFIASRDTVSALHRDLQGTCAEMEGAAVAHVCAMNGIPYVVIRSMSDKADGSAHINFPEFTRTAAEKSYRIVKEMVQALG
jgi:adenosylhomocysteine nucleosidase